MKRWAGAMAILGAVGLVSLPVWFPWVLKPALAQLGLHYQGYERRGYTRFALTGLEGAWESTRLEVERVDGSLPPAWLWARAFGRPDRSPSLTVGPWRIRVSPSQAAATATTAPAGPGPSMTSTLDDLEAIAWFLNRWLPVTVVPRGLLQVESQSFSFTNAEWRQGRLRAELQVSPVPESIHVTAAFSSRTNATVSAVSARREVAAWAQLDRDPTGWRLSGPLEWGTNRASVSGRFGLAGWWPAEGRLQGDALRFPTGTWTLQGYEHPTFSLGVQVASNRFELEATMTARPSVLPETATRPRIEITLRARGDPNRVVVHGLEIRAGASTATLTNPVPLQTARPFLTNHALFQVGMDLAKAPGPSLTGRVDGVVRVEVREGKEFTASLDFAGADICGYGFETTRSSLNGVLAWPQLKVQEVEIHLRDGPILSASATADLSTAQLIAARWRLAGDQLANRWPELRCESLTATGAAAGSFTNLTHSGEATATQLNAVPGKSLNVRASWQGTNLHLAAATLELDSARSRLALTGSVQVGAAASSIQMTVNTATLEREGRQLYTLDRPCPIRWRANAAGSTPGSWALAFDSFEWSGPGRRISLGADLTWPAQGQLRLAAQAVRFADLADFVPVSWTNFSCQDFHCDAEWSNGPVRAALTFEASGPGWEGQALALRGSLRSGDKLHVDELTLRSKWAPALVVKGTLPFALVPGPSNAWLRADARQPLDLRATLENLEGFSWPLENRGSLRISAPKAEVVAGGTLDKPTVSVTIGPSAANWQPGTNGGFALGVDQFRVNAVVLPDRIELRDLSGTLDGETFHAQGEWPLPAQFWTQLRTHPETIDWSAAQGRLELANAQLRGFSRYAPAWLSPEGQLHVDVALRPGRILQGQVLVTNVSTRPLGQLSPLREVSAQLQFNGEEVTLSGFQGEIGGQPVQATGSARFAPGRAIAYQVRLQGSNLPLARSVEFLVRGDLDLQLKGDTRSAPTVSGQVMLENGLFVQHARAFIIRSPERPTLRPPYFSLTNAPFADWNLDLVVRGDQFLRVRTPIFHGMASMNVRLGGRLGDPVIKGDARVNSGLVTFPFGTLRVDQAYASLDAQSVRGPDLLVRASGRNYRYDIRLEIKGPADGANVLFSSTPPLTSEQILLMLTAGELPKNENENAFSTEARAGQLATFLGRDLVARITGGDTGRERLIVNTSENLTEEGKTTYSIEYRLTDRWSLVGEYDRFSALNAAVKWRILSR